MRNSTLMFADGTPSGVSTTLAFSHASLSLISAFGFVRGSSECFAMNCSANLSMMALSMLRPPTFLSYARATTSSLPVTKEQMTASNEA